MQGQLNELLQFNGGYLLHLDGTCDGASPHLISVLDGITEIVLENIKLISENAEDLILFLELIRNSYGDPIAVVSDMGKGIDRAIREVFPHVPSFICHFHFLKAAGNDLLGEEQEIIRAKLRRHKVRPALQTLRKRLEQLIASRDPQVIPILAKGITEEYLPQACLPEKLPPAAAYLLVTWVLDASSACDGFGFPFDQAYLVFYQRIREAHNRLTELFSIQLRGDWKDNKCYGWIIDVLRSAVNDKQLAEAAARMEEKVEVFSRLRQAMRITLPEHKREITDLGELSGNMNTIRKEVTRFCTRLIKQNPYAPDYRKLAERIQARGSQLFADPVPVHTAAGSTLIQPQRTNNLLETFFRKLMRGYRKRNGFSAVEKILKAMLPDTPLAMNLKNERYMNLLLGEGITLEQRFAELDAREIRRLLKEKPVASCANYPQLKKIIRLPDLPKSITALLKKTAA